MTAMEAVMELRNPGIIGKWEERLFRLDFESLKYFARDDAEYLGEFPLDSMENLIYDPQASTMSGVYCQELRFTVQGRLWRIRTREENLARDWYSKLRIFTEQGFSTPPPSVVQKATPGSFRSVTPPPTRSRRSQLHDSHRKKLDRLQEKRKEQEYDELKRIQESSFKNRMTKSSRSMGMRMISQREILANADRLHKEHKLIQDRLRSKKENFDKEETDKIAEEKKVNKPTRVASEPNLLTSREAGDRLYSDAERRELWRQQARDAQAKEELTMVCVGMKGSGVNGQQRCLDLHNKAKEKSEKIQKEAEKIETEKKDLLEKEVMRQKLECMERQAAIKLALDVGVPKEEFVVSSGDKAGEPIDKAALIELILTQKESAAQLAPKHNSRKFEALYMDSQARNQKRQAAVKANSAAQKEELEKATLPPKVEKNPMFNHVTAKYHYNNNAPKKEDKKKVGSKPKKKRVISHADYALRAMQSAIALRSGYSGYDIRSSDKEKLVRMLKKVIQQFRQALQQVDQDPGYANLCSRSSMRLFQEHLLPEHEGWSHRLEPDPIRQVEDDLDNLLNTAAKAQEVLKEQVAPGMPWPREGPSPGMRPHPTGVPTALWAYDPGVKPLASAETNALVKFGPGEGPQRHRHLLDLSRLLLVFPSCDMLQAGLEQILKRFEVVDVRNFFAHPGRLGVRFIEVLVVVIVRDGREQVPHVCELRLEPLCFYTASKKALESLKEFTAFLRDVYFHAHMDLDAVECIARDVLNRPPESHRIRKFRCHLHKRYGSTVCAWRKALGGGRLLTFNRFREVCYSLNCGDLVTQLWQELDPSRGGCISIWELDPEAVSLLAKLRSRMQAVLANGADDDLDGAAMFQRLAGFVRPTQQGVLDRKEFRHVARPLGITPFEADHVFACLDHFMGGVQPATIDASDIAWLKRLPTLADTDAIVCAQNQMAVQDLCNDHLDKILRGEIEVSKPGDDRPGSAPKAGAAAAKAKQSPKAKPSPKPGATIVKKQEASAASEEDNLADMGVDDVGGQEGDDSEENLGTQGVEEGDDPDEEEEEEVDDDSGSDEESEEDSDEEDDDDDGGGPPKKKEETW